MTLPPFPVDDATLDLLDAALNPGPHAERSSVLDFLDLMSRLGGSDPEAVEFVADGIRHMRDPQYHTNDVLAALVAEVRRLRGMCREYQVIFEMGYARYGEAADRWRAEQPDERANVMPDLGILLAWLMQRVEQAETRAAARDEKR